MDFFGLEKLSLVDYDGKVSATVFTGGCNFKCDFCHNSPLVFDINTLNTISQEEVLAYLEKRKGLLEGLCISGGEPTLNKDLPYFCEKVKKLGYSVKLDTNGTNPNMVKLLSKNGLCDYFAMDIKNDKENYAQIIGFNYYDTSQIEKTVDFFLTSDVDYEFRTTIVKEFHNEINIENIGIWLKGAKNYFLQKFKDSESCIKSHLSPVEYKIALIYLDMLKKYIPNTHLRGY